jgi:hypothetical protein
VIDFLCPNGHRIRCPAEQAGQAAKCPRCGVKFRIPSAEEIELDESSPGDTSEAPMELTSASGGGSSGSQPRPQKEPQIEFLCPNGHHLHGPASLQGRPGACPECGSRFRIPIIEEAAGTGAEEPLDLAAPTPVDATGSATAKLARAKPSGSTPGLTQAAQAAAAEFSLREPEAASTASAKHSTAPKGHPLAELVRQLWAAKGEEAKVELHLKGGDSLVPDCFVKGLSRGDYGVFGVKTGEGNWTLMVLRWDEVERVALKDLKSLPQLAAENL